MKRLLKKAKKQKFNIGEKVRISDIKDIFYRVMDYNKDLEEYTLIDDEQRKVEGVLENEIKGKHSFFEGDEVSFYRDPLEKNKKFIVKDVLNDGKYLIEGEDETHTNINGKNLMLYSDI